MRVTATRICCPRCGRLLPKIYFLRAPGATGARFAPGHGVGVDCGSCGRMVTFTAETEEERTDTEQTL